MGGHKLFRKKPPGMEKGARWSFNRAVAVSSCLSRLFGTSRKLVRDGWKFRRLHSKRRDGHHRPHEGKLELNWSSMSLPSVVAAVRSVCVGHQRGFTVVIALPWSGTGGEWE
ncbi:hypothetical protein MLD38_037279 [Melastoma candidum]|uniref:Uncharacterized protein n=1 Tax=Melastoma candidum TaxID=119954 RepID=A0ACB9LNB9_9MYRT|nr:hypothetical protein MLD38_037279 [Melastoma candidum]